MENLLYSPRRKCRILSWQSDIRPESAKKGRIFFLNIETALLIPVVSWLLQKRNLNGSDLGTRTQHVFEEVLI